MEIQIVLTGGTIGSEYRQDGVIALADSSPVFCAAPAAFARADWRTHISSPFQIHSENLTPAHWRRLAAHLRALPLAESDALIITHGTDTLAYTANFLALLLHRLEIPVFLLSSDRPLADADANGHANIRRIEELLAGEIAPGIYVPYRNRDDGIIVHKAERLLQAADFSDDFQSVANPNVNDLNHLTAVIWESAFPRNSDTAFTDNNKRKSLLYALPPFYDSARAPRILALRSFPGMDLSYYNFEAPDAILLGTYHSGTIFGGGILAAVGVPDDAAAPLVSSSASDTGATVRFAEKAARAGVPVYAAPLYAHASSSEDQNTDVIRSKKPYAGTHAQIESGLVRPLYDMSFEMAFAYLNLLYFCKL